MNPNLFPFMIYLACFFPGLEGWHMHHSGFRRFCSTNMKHAKSGGCLRTTYLLAIPPTDKDIKSEGVEVYRNVVTNVLSNFMQKEKLEKGGSNDNGSISKIDFQVPKICPSTSLETLASALDFELTEREWFVTGNANPSFFSDNFKFQDPDVKIDGLEEYCKGVYTLFDQSTSRAEIISTVVNEEASTPDRPVITCTWRLSGGVNIGFGLTIKPYIVYTDFVIDPMTMLIVFQEDRFDIPSWDILLRYEKLYDVLSFCVLMLTHRVHQKVRCSRLSSAKLRNLQLLQYHSVI
jgi:hypothetical protein